MRVLLLPHTGLKHIQGDSNYLYFLDLARYLTRRGHHVFMLMPQYARLEVTHLPGLTYVFKEYHYDYYTEYALWDAKLLVEKFGRTVGLYQIDVLVTAIAQQVPVYRTLLSDFVHSRDIVSYVVEPGVYVMSENQVMGEMSYVMTQLGYAYSTPIFLTSHDKDMVLQNARKCLSGKDIRAIQNNAMILPVGIPCSYIDEVTKDVTEKFDKFTLFYGGRMNEVKRPEKIIELYATFYESGKDVQIKMTTNTKGLKILMIPELAAALKRYESAIDLKTEVGRAEYLRIAKRAHVGISWSDTEGFPVGFWEQMYMGLPVMFIDRPWVRSQLPEWYPWIFGSKEEAYAMLLHIMENYDEVAANMGRMQEYIRAYYSDEVVYSKIEADMLEKLQRPKSYWKTRSITWLILRAIEGAKPSEYVSLDQVLSGMEKLGKAFIMDRFQRMNQPRLPRDYDVYRTILAAGLVDTGETPRPVFRIPKGWDPETGFRRLYPDGIKEGRGRRPKDG